MRILVDECIDERFRHSFSSHECQTARYAGFAGFKNGQLLDAAEGAKFDVIVTMDQGLPYQQNLMNRTIAIIVLVVPSSRLKDLTALVPDCLTALSEIKPGEIVKIPANRS